MNDLRISLIQSPIFWEDKAKNLAHFERKLAELIGNTDLAVLPETFTTGFSMDASRLAETNDEATVATIKDWAAKFGFAICGSFIGREEERVYNRGFFITPEGESFYYDKRHLFRMADEHHYYHAGNDLSQISYNGWNIRLAICYDLRFPVWLRNTQDNPYDLLIVTANWPKARKAPWELLLKARAVENQCYVCGVNRVGEDANHIAHSGNSALIDYKGNTVAEIGDNEEATVTGTISKEALNQFRQKFPAWMDADQFEIK